MRSLNRSFSFVALLLLAGLLLTGSPGLAQGDRSSMTLNEAGQVLRFIGTHDNIPTAVIDTNGSEASVLSIEDLIGGDEVVGMGAIADLNDSGVAVIQVDLGTADLTDPDNPVFTGDDDGNQVLITSSGGAPTVIVVAKNDGMGDVFGDDTLCHIGPMPEINNAGRVAYFGHLDIDGSGLTGRACEEAEFRNSDPNFGGGVNATFAFSSNFVEQNGGAGDLMLDPLTDRVTRVGGALGTVTTTKSAIFRYTPGGTGNELLLTGQAAGIEADMLTVTDSRWVSSSTDFFVGEVDIIRNADNKLTSGGVIGAYATLSSESVVIPQGVVDFADCMNTTIVQTTDNPIDDPDGSDPFVRYRTTCPEVNVGVSFDEPLYREAIILLNGATKEVVAVAGPPGESDYQAFDYEDSDGSQGQFVMNDAGQVLFKATVGQVDDPFMRGDPVNCGHWQESCFVTEYRLELYSPGGVIANIVKTGDPVPTPGSNAAFCDFAPHYGLADDGSFAFLATIAGDGTCEFQSGTSGAIDTIVVRGGNQEADALFYYSNGVITELMRTQIAADSDTGPGPFTSSWSGNQIDEIGSVAVVEAPGLVQFFVENFDYEPDFCPAAPRGSSDFGGGEWTAVLSWTEDSGLESILEEGELLGTDADDYIFRIHTVGPKLRAQGNASAELVALLEIDRNEDCSTADEEDDGDRDVIVVTQGTPPPGNVLEIPVGGPVALGVFASLLVLLSLVFVRSRGSLG